MDLTSAELGQLIIGMLAEYANGNNVMAYARNVLGNTIGEGGRNHRPDWCAIGSGIRIRVICFGPSNCAVFMRMSSVWR